MKNIIKVDVLNLINNLLYVIDKLAIISNVDDEILFRYYISVFERKQNDLKNRVNI